MHGRKTWAVVGAAAVLGVSTGVASASLGINDRADSAQAGHAIAMAAGQGDSAGSAQSANEAPRDRNMDPSPESADSPGASAVDSPVAGAQSANSPAPATRRAANRDSSANSPAPAPRRAATSANSANSPAPAPRPRNNGGDSGASANSGGSADSAGSAD